MDQEAMTKDVMDAVAFFPRAFTIVLALALGEAFKQFVTDKAETAIQWSRLPALLAFLFMVFPFFHGMNRYFFQTYQHPLPPASYAGSLLFDSSTFMAEAALFFVMSRSLADEQWRRFFVALLVLLAIDTTWGVFELQHLADIRYWIILNIVLAVALGGLLAYFWKKTTVAWPAIWAAVATFITTSISYYLHGPSIFLRCPEKGTAPVASRAAGDVHIKTASAPPATMRSRAAWR